MIEINGDMWSLLDSYDGVCITTNGEIKANGDSVMGRGVALGFKNLYPEGPSILARKVIINGNIFQPIMWNDTITFYAFPTKDLWREHSKINLIKESAIALAKVANENPNKKYLLPRPGCSNGGLQWSEVSVILKDILPNNVHVINFRR